MLVSEIIGNIGADAEIKEFSGKKYVSFSVAHSDFSKDQNGNKVEQTTWVSILWYGDGGGLFQS
jgi:single-strand DNA-binding protein